MKTETKAVTVELETTELARLEQAAKADDRSVASFVRHLVRQRLGEQQATA